MQYRIQFSLDNDSLRTESGATDPQAVASLLRVIADAIEAGGTLAQRIRDDNGNTIGSAGIARTREGG